MILRALLRLIGEVALWTSLVTLIAAAVAAIVRWSMARRIEQLALFGATLVGALVFAGVSDRFGLPGAAVLDIGRRPLPVVWVVAGAVFGALTIWLLRKRRAVRRPDRAISAGSPASDAGPR